MIGSLKVFPCDAAYMRKTQRQKPPTMSSRLTGNSMRKKSPFVTAPRTIPTNHPDDPKADPGNVEEDGLERVEAHKAVCFERINDEEDDAGNEAGKIRRAPRPWGVAVRLPGARLVLLLAATGAVPGRR